MWKEIRNLWTSDNLLNEAWDLTYEAISIDAEMFDDATDALWGDNHKTVQRLIFKKDKLINKYERDIRRKVITHLTVQGNDSLAAGLVLSTVIVDVERIGDYIKNIVDLTEMHPEEIHGKNTKDKLHDIENSIKRMFKDAPECIETGDEDHALQIYSETKEIGKTCDKYIKKLITKNEEDLDPSEVAILVLYFRYLKRINAHLRNIISSVINPYDRIGFKPKKKK
ncbi:MAG: hypothetical protein HN580_05085 [Deltaproteobacteria bacterium]|jgi:phosphate transport system protein|nr:hypothetical protein [Candidatus Neomarinimicrobiota bacterium]MBT7888371.1 hypothetical protein [Deltaproteobacteria bacterium]MBT4362512.1 hypothetical protein [Candidatus Neomarinimicrobiota bacterium]MBT4714486.1 hypothetical protein [Candidatus Neomarinimicrobiota bacterium]MBT4946525.1 hypothetical protein [Candidatus Neomarinimicrobiota bacterium]